MDSNKWQAGLWPVALSGGRTEETDLRVGLLLHAFGQAALGLLCRVSAAVVREVFSGGLGTVAIGSKAGLITMHGRVLLGIKRCMVTDSVSTPVAFLNTLGSLLCRSH